MFYCFWQSPDFSQLTGIAEVGVSTFAQISGKIPHYKNKATKKLSTFFIFI